MEKIFQLEFQLRQLWQAFIRFLLLDSNHLLQQIAKAFYCQ
jgi:hypothetical protein